MIDEQTNMVETNTATPAESAEVAEQQKPQIFVNPSNERRYTRQEVTDMMKRRVERSHNAFFKRYNVTDLKALDELFDKSNKFQSMQDEYGKIQLTNSDLTRENAFLRNNIDPEKYDDIIALFKGKGIDFTEEELIRALITHPEWLKKTSNVTTITTLGSESHNNPVETEDAKKRRIFGI